MTNAGPQDTDTITLISGIVTNGLNDCFILVQRYDDSYWGDFGRLSKIVCETGKPEVEILVHWTQNCRTRNSIFVFTSLMSPFIINSEHNSTLPTLNDTFM